MDKRAGPIHQGVFLTNPRVIFEGIAKIIVIITIGVCGPRPYASVTCDGRTRLKKEASAMNAAENRPSSAKN